MFIKAPNLFYRNSNSESFNMTPIIDIVFLLIIFFLVVCKFIEAENFPVDVPDDCKFAQNDTEPGSAVATVTVVREAYDKVGFAVGPEKISPWSYTDITEKIAELINERLKGFPDDHRVVTLRIDKDICFAQAQYALAGVAASSATDIQLAVLKDKKP